jgi:microcompartment protein CcmL/EutN
LKGAEVTLWQLRLAEGLGGKGIVLFAGLVADVETAVEIAVDRVQEMLVSQVIIPQLHEEMKENVATFGRFGGHFNWQQA